jgi:hypothetical protein
MIQKPIEALQELRDAISQQSCVPKEPFVKLEEGGKASILNYNLPQATCYDATSFIKLGIALEKFKPEELRVPRNNFWDIQSTRTVEAIRLDLDTRVDVLPRQNLLTDAGTIKASSVAKAQNGITAQALRTVSKETPLEAPIEEASMLRSYRPSLEKDYMSIRIKQGYLPVPYRRFSGLLDIRYIPKPITPKPTLGIVLHFKVCSYLGDYGAGQTVKTFSLLPDERMDISIRHYLRNESVRKQSQHILDSFSTECADELQHTVDEENTHISGSSDTSSVNSNWNLGGNLGINVGAFSLGVQGGGGKTKGSSFTSTVQDQVRQLDSAITKHVAKADTKRQIDVNTESVDTSTAEEEETIKRSLYNPNKSRVLNFVYRQLLQEFFTITYLDNVTFSYSNGYPEYNKTCSLSDLEKMLSEILTNDTTVEEEANKIYTYLCNIIDYTGTKQSFIELVTEDNGNCINPDAETITQSYVRKRRPIDPDTNKETELQNTYKGKTVNGIILSVKHRITRTSSLITDAVLGQGEALDCYNQKLQDAAAQKTHLDNIEQVQRIDIIESLDDPKQKAENFKKVYGNCCTTPQTQVIS